MKLDKAILVKKAHYEKLLERFDLGRAEGCRIDVACPMCEEYMDNVGCAGCPFEKHYGMYGCVPALTDAGGVEPSIGGTYDVSSGCVMWNKSDDRAARAIIRRIRKAIEENLTYRGKPRREGA